MKTQRIAKYSLIGLSILAVLLLLAINRGLAGLVNDFVPGAALWVHLILLAVEALALIWFWRGLFHRRHYLLLKRDMSPEEREAFTRELIARLQDNPHLRKLAGQAASGPGSAAVSLSAPQGGAAPVSSATAPGAAGAPGMPGVVGAPGAFPGPEDPAYVERCLAELDKKANEEIKSMASRVFLATALSQNGRLDGLIMLLSLCRLVWRISYIYNQRPHPREIAALYWTVISTAFLALSIEELNLTTEITVGFGESLQASGPAAATNSLPFVGAALQTFTASAIDGTANCFLALRAGIITRNAYSYSITGRERPSRAAVFREAGSLLLGMSGELMGRLSKTLAQRFVSISRLAQDKTLQAGKNLIQGVGGGIAKVGGGIGDSVEWLADGTVQAVKSTGSAVAATGRVTGNVVKATGLAGVDAVVATGKLAGDAVLATGKLAGGAVTATGKLAGEAAAVTGMALKKAGTLAVTPVAWAVDAAGKTLSAPFRSRSPLRSRDEDKGPGQSA